MSSRGRRRIQSLAEHPESYVRTSDLAAYWMVSRKQIYKQIEAGTLKAIRLGPRLLRIATSEAIEFERIAKMAPAPLRPGEVPAHARTMSEGDERRVALPAPSAGPQKALR